MRLEKRDVSPPLVRLTAPVLAVLTSLLICSSLIKAAGAPVLWAYWTMLVGAVGSLNALSETLTRATPLIFTGLAVAVAFRARIWNIGAEGQLYAGALATVLVAADGGRVAAMVPHWALPVIAAAAAFVAGAALLLGPVVLKVKLGVDEVVTTLLSNFVMLLFVSFLLDGPFKDPMSMGWPQTPPVDSAVSLRHLLGGATRLHAGFLFALLSAAFLWLFNVRSVWGYEMRAVGYSRSGARFAGMPVTSVLLRVALLSGGIAGLAGFNEIAGVKGYLTLDMSPGFGYSGIVVAMLAQLHPVAVVASAIFVAAIFVGADAMSRAVAVPNYIADVMVSVSLLTMLVAMMLTRYRICHE
ncbi:ABC transporter permease [Bradyrhizobium sp. LTSP849]|uniref:ABC transporter permease n=1 Tax=Bradyrhizobium sp. LTSP849 TaxID=1615890 RepID=UPI0005D213E2|nr:ABC transporter permease [Bradyrhizobium sp. LTSP849]KJC36710.1 ABC transporter permease [Bradyrhizobium sp. LTSP849]